jgi:hypothetical protein
MNSRFLLAAELRSGVRAPLQDIPMTDVAFQRGTTCAIAAAVAAEAWDQRVSQRIKDRQAERFRSAFAGRALNASRPPKASQSCSYSSSRLGSG